MTNSPHTAFKLLLSAQEAALAMAICPKTLWAHTVPRGTIPCLKIGTRVLYDPVDLRSWINARKNGDAAE